MTAETSLVLDDLISRSFRYPGDKLPDVSDFRDMTSHMGCMWEYRKAYVEYSWVILAHEWVKALADLIGRDKAVEVCAGLGHLTFWLRKYGADVTASDIITSTYPRAHAFPDFVKRQGEKRAQSCYVQHAS